MRNHEVTTRQLLLDNNGEIAEPGWARSQIWDYKRSMIKAPKFKIKEWDYYLVMGQGFACAFTLSDDGYVGLQSVSLLTFGETPWEHTETVLDVFPMGKMHHPENSSEGNVLYDNGRLKMSFVKSEGERRIICEFENFFEGKPFKCDITMKQPDMDTMVIATPWDKKHAFYYNQKINCMRASGSATFDGKTYEFNPDTDFGTLDWGRGVWTYDNTWNWGSGNCDLNGHAFGFNIGYGFGNTKAATENILFYDGVAHKLDDITFNIPEDSYMSPWTFTSSDGRFEMNFVPVLDRAAKIDFKVIVSDQHQVFGKMSGTAILDDGTKLEIKDMMCFAERVHNKY
ncbi:MAG: DUF2804 domain-containing protein [Lachnospiraceae bacterium]|nr:DUF2804 domain-containing protein [Lachnospiraceae bacterium]MBP5298962.1 DUF2804 domain-containing protein [Lachnospiraceae bacterium]